MDHLFLEAQVREMAAAFEREVKNRPLPYFEKNNRISVAARVLDGAGDALIRLGTQLKAKSGRPVVRPETA